MSYAKIALLVSMGLFGLWFTLVWWMRERVGEGGVGGKGTKPLFLAIGFGTNFLDTLGIGSFATTTALFRATKALDDRWIPGTLNVGHMLPTLAQAAVFVTVVEVEMKTLVAMIAASVVGAWFGAGLVAGFSRRATRLGMGSLLIVAAGFMLVRILEAMPSGGDALALDGSLLLIAVIGNFILGALMTLGIGLYAPCMVLVSLLGMNPRAAFPIMMGSCAFLMAAAGVRFVQRAAHAQPVSLGLTLAGVPGVLIAAFIVKELPLDTVRGLVVVVVLYTAVSLLYDGLRDRASAVPPKASGEGDPS
jgi:uncharacterized membrane protein YfcA